MKIKEKWPFTRLPFIQPTLCASLRRCREFNTKTENRDTTSGTSRLMTNFWFYHLGTWKGHLGDSAVMKNPKCVIIFSKCFLCCLSKTLFWKGLLRFYSLEGPFWRLLQFTHQSNPKWLREETSKVGLDRSKVLRSQTHIYQTSPNSIGSYDFQWIEPHRYRNKTHQRLFWIWKTVSDTVWVSSCPTPCHYESVSKWRVYPVEHSKDSSQQIVSGHCLSWGPVWFEVFNNVVEVFLYMSSRCSVG